ncbi:uncharacterized protein LOC120633731 [Pararge aegeria]|uniref:uncharacterized protein LOC120633731 n=1 Tax=Pararge aegeria TaxID=116150 RepID=UPI0019D11315|nr:uncharacterized protein LOC120633731 [Pararge aegeria]
MLTHVLLLSLLGAGAAVRTRETVRRVVLLRTSGSDLAPAASGYIYSKGGGRESVVAMAEREVMAHLADMSSAERVIPVTEQEEPADGLADVDYKKIFDDYSAGYGGGRAYDDYLESLKRFKGGRRRDYDAGSAEGNGDAGSYHKAKFESYSITGDHEGHDDDDAHSKLYDQHSRGVDEERKGTEDDSRIFHKVYENSGETNNHKYLGERVKAFPDEHQYYGSSGRGHKYGSYKSKEPEAKQANAGAASAASAGQAPAEQPEGGAADADRAERSSFDYKVEH